MRLCYGTTRAVLLIGKRALKFPVVTEGRLFLLGLLDNMQERQFARMDDPRLCSVRFSLPGGWLVVMQRTTPLTREEFDALDYETFVNHGAFRVSAENKLDSFGWLEGRIVAVDYG